MTMGLLAEEKRTGTIEVLLTMPLQGLRGDPRQVPRRARAARACCCCCTLPYPISVATLGKLDWGPVMRGLPRGAAAGRGDARDRRAGLELDREPADRVLHAPAMICFAFWIVGALPAVRAAGAGLGARVDLVRLPLREHAARRDRLARRHLLPLDDRLQPRAGVPVAREPALELKPWRCANKPASRVNPPLFLLVLGAHPGAAQRARRVRRERCAPTPPRPRLFSLSTGSKRLADEPRGSAWRSARTSARTCRRRTTRSSRYVRDLLAEYRDASSGKITLRVHRSPRPTKRSRRPSATASTRVQDQKLEADSFSVQEGYRGISFQYLGDTKAIARVDTTEGLEYEITQIDQAADRREDRDRRARRPRGRRPWRKGLTVAQAVPADLRAEGGQGRPGDPDGRSRRC